MERWRPRYWDLPEANNQGIIGLEVFYDSVLAGKNGQILTLTDARGVELSDTGESRKEPEAGNDLVISIDRNIQAYAEQAAYRVMEQKQADSVAVILMNPKNGEILAMADVPEFDLNNPFFLETTESGENQQDALNTMWRNSCLNDTYEPGLP